MADDATEALPVPLLDYRRSGDPQLPAVMGRWPQFWLGFGVWYAALLWTGCQLIFRPVLFRYGSSDSRLLLVLVNALPMLAATVWVLARRVWDGRAVAALLAVAWVTGSRPYVRGFAPPESVVPLLVVLVAACLYLAMATRYQGVAIGLAVGSLTAAGLVAALFVVTY